MVILFQNDLLSDVMEVNVQVMLFPVGMRSSLDKGTPSMDMLEVKELGRICFSICFPIFSF